jgi:transcriptional regulator with GAF, ATPase, and Fis domain
VLDCGTISDALVASEFFGHERGAYTGAHERRRGRFEVAASGGTLFLDEIGNLCVFGQRALLRVLEERVIYRVGSTTPIPLVLASSRRPTKPWEMMKTPARSDQIYSTGCRSA